MEGSRYVLFDLQFSIERLSEVGSKARVSVQDHSGWQSEPAIDVFQIQSGHLLARYSYGTWKEHGCSRAALINNGQDGVTAFAFVELGDQIHRHYLEWERRRVC